MTDRSSKRGTGDRDFSVNAFRVVQEAIGEAEPSQPDQEQAELSEEERHAAAVALGRLGGKKGGKARAEKLTPERRREIGKKAANARWGKRQ